MKDRSAHPKDERKKRRNPLRGVRIPLPKQEGGPHNPKNAYKRRPRSARRDELSEDYGGEYREEYGEI